MTRRNPTSLDRILSAARGEFATHGRAGARTQRIAARAGVNKQLIHYYFKTKDGLYRQSLIAAGQEIASALGQAQLVGLTAVERLRRLLRMQFDILLERSELTRLLLQAEEDIGWAAAATQPVVSLLTEGQATGFFRDDIDPLALARHAFVLQLSYFAMGPVTSAWGTGAAWRDGVADLIVRGCTW